MSIQTEQEYRLSRAAEKNAALLANVSPAATKQLAELEAKAAEIAGEVDEFSSAQLAAIRTIENHLSQQNKLRAEIDTLTGILGIFESRAANLAQLALYVVQSAQDPYARKNAEILKNHVIQADLLAPVIPHELEVRKAELGKLGREITQLSKDRDINLPALMEAHRRGPQPVEPEISFGQK